MKPQQRIAFCNEVIALKSTIEGGFLALAKRLQKVRDDRLYLGQWTNFREYLMELRMSEATASKLINIYQKFVVEAGIEEDTLIKAGGWTVLAESLKYIGKQLSPAKAVELASTLSRDDFRRELTELSTGIQQRECGHEDTYTIRVCRKCGDRIPVIEIE